MNHIHMKLLSERLKYLQFEVPFINGTALETYEKSCEEIHAWVCIITSQPNKSHNKMAHAALFNNTSFTESPHLYYFEKTIPVSKLWANNGRWETIELLQED